MNYRLSLMLVTEKRIYYLLNLRTSFIIFGFKTSMMIADAPNIIACLTYKNKEIQHAALSL